MFAPKPKILSLCVLASASSLASCSLLFDHGSASSDSGPIAAPDAAPDAAPPSLTPFFTLLPLACGETKITPTNISVALDSGAPAVVRYRWTLKDPTGAVVLTRQGDPVDPLPRAPRVLGGSYGQPEFNATLYRGSRIGIFTRNTEMKIPSILQLMPLDEGNYELEAIVGIPNSRQLTARIREPGTDGLPYSDGLTMDCVNDDTCGTLQYKTFQFPTKNISGFVTNGMLQIVFGSQGTYYIDGVRLRSVPDGQDLVDNESFDSTIDWEVGNPQSLGFDSVPIPDGLAAYGEYELSLQVIDVNATEGPVTTKTLVHAGCSD